MNREEKFEKSRWSTIEEESQVTVIPETDIKPHGTRISDTEYELTNECPCKPRIIAGEKGELYQKPIVVHNSFEDMERIDKAMIPHEEH